MKNNISFNLFICLQAIFFLLLYGCASNPKFDEELVAIKAKAKKNLTNDIDTFNGYKDRPQSDGPYNETNNKEFLLSNTPLFISSDSTITEVFNYRFWMMLKHLRKYQDSEDNKEYWVYTEFYGNPNHASRSGAISCPLGQQFYEARWVKDPKYLKSYAEYFLTGSGATLNQRENGSFLTNLSRPESHHFSSWLVNGVASFLKIHPDVEWMKSMLPAMEKHQEVWDELFTVHNPDSKTNGMYKIMDLYDGMEFSLSAVEGLIESDGPFSIYTKENWRENYLGWDTTGKVANSAIAKEYPNAFNGGYPWFYLVRPSVNSYAYGNFKSLATMYNQVGNAELSKEYSDKAIAIQEKTLRVLWDDEANFFMSFSAGDNEYGVKDYEAPVRESVGYTPWYFNMIPLQNHNNYDTAWKLFGSDEGFYNTQGMTTAERKHPYYNEQAYAWNGRGWPFQNSVVYKAYANYLRDYKKNVSNADKQLLLDYVNKLAAMHGEGEKNIGEWYIPSDGKEFGGVKDYFHSTFADIIISDVIGLRPDYDGTISIEPLIPEESWDFFYLGDLLIDGHTVDIVWNKDWQPRKEGDQSWFCIWVDGVLKSKSKKRNTLLKIEIQN